MSGTQTLLTDPTKRALTALNSFALKNGYDVTSFDTRKCRELIAAKTLNDIAWSSNLLTQPEFRFYILGIRKSKELPSWVPTTFGALYHPRTLSGEYPISKLFETTLTRSYVAYLAKLPKETLKFFAHDENSAVRANLANRTDLPKHIQSILASDISKDVLQSIRDNKTFTEEYRTLAALRI